jgi:hypothetical protein
MDALMAVLVNVPFAKCLCVDAGSAGANFETYAMTNCFYFAPASLKPQMLGMIQRALVVASGAGITRGVEDMCRDLTAWAGESMSDSMRPYFVRQLEVESLSPLPAL